MPTVTQEVSMIGPMSEIENAYMDLKGKLAVAESHIEALEKALWFEHYKDVYPEAQVDHGDCAACRLLAALKEKP